MRARVVILQELLPQYRIPFFEGLRAVLRQDDIELRLVHGSARGDRAARGDEAQLSWATRVDNRTMSLLGRELLYQPALPHIRGADLVVVEQANRLLLNYWLLAQARLRRAPRVALWGHGANLQSRRPQGPAEQLKRRLSTLPDWWFAYTQGSADRVVDLGYPRERVSVVQNAVDTALYDSARTRTTKLAFTCVYVGSLHQDKRIPFLLNAAASAAEAEPNFRMHVVGDGDYRSAVLEAAGRHPWLRYHGALFGQNKAEVLASSQLLLMPGLVGLAAVESLAARTPIVTTNISYHSPEIEYLHAGNAVVLPAAVTAAEYGHAVVDLLQRTDELERLRQGCARDAAGLSLERMVDNFARGVRASLRLA